MPTVNTKVAKVRSQIHQKLDSALPGPLSLSAPTVIFGAVLLVRITFALGRRSGRKAGYKKWVEKYSRPTGSDDRQTVQVSADIGVEVFLDKKGYRIRVEKTREHRYLAEQNLSRSLEPNEVVHHINGRPADNRLENLCVLDSMKHEQFHSWLKWKKDLQGYYPPESQLREILVKEYGGIVLNSGAEFKRPS